MYICSENEVLYAYTAQNNEDKNIPMAAILATELTEK